jgi:hypothetical protein
MSCGDLPVKCHFLLERIVTGGLRMRGQLGDFRTIQQKAATTHLPFRRKLLFLANGKIHYGVQVYNRLQLRGEY